MLNVGKIEEGFVLDHIQAGMAMSIYHHLQLDKLDCTVAIIKTRAATRWAKGHSESRMRCQHARPRRSRLYRP